MSELLQLLRTRPTTADGALFGVRFADMSDEEIRAAALWLAEELQHEQRRECVHDRLARFKAA